MSERYLLYQYDSCPFCRRVRWFLEDAGIEIPVRNTLLDAEARRELIEGGGRATVPCLKVEQDGKVHWLYESSAIVDYLQRRYGHAQSDFQPREQPQ